MIVRVLWIITLSLIAFTVAADELLWENLKRDQNMIVLMRNSESSGNRDGASMLVWDGSGNA
jgi:hypothetical protein